MKSALSLEAKRGQIYGHTTTLWQGYSTLLKTLKQIYCDNTDRAPILYLKSKTNVEMCMTVNNEKSDNCYVYRDAKQKIQ